MQRADRPAAPLPGTTALVPWRTASAFAAVYAVATWLGAASRIDGTPLAVVWPAAAVGYLWLLWSSQRVRLSADMPLLALVAGALSWATGATAEMSLAFAIASVLQAAVAVVVVRTLGGDWRLRTGRHLAMLVATSSAGAVAGGLVATTAMALLSGVDFLSTLAAWVLGNASSTLVFGAVAVRVADRGWRSLASGRGAGEWASTVAVLTVAYVVVFGAQSPALLSLFVLPLTVWVAVRFSTTTTAGHVLLAAVFVVSLTAAGYGPFHAESTVVCVMLAQGFVFVLGLIALTLALYRDEREMLMADLRAESERATAHAAMLDTVLETVDVAVVACDAGGHLTLFNRAAREFHGSDADPDVDPSQLAHRFNLYDADGTTPLDPERIPLTVALRDGRVHDRVITIAPVGLPAHTVRVDGRRLLAPDGRILGAVVAQTDITRLQTSEREFRQAFLAGPTPSARIDADGTIEQVNPALRRLLSLPSRHLLGRALVDLVLPDDRRRARALLTDPTSGPAEVRLAQAGGRVVWCEVSVTSLTSPSGDCRRLVQLIDVTARREREERLERMAQLDPLTGLGNRAVATARLEEIAQQPAHEQVLLAYLDLDGFKDVNDQHGHDAGDAVLIAVASRLKDVVRTGDSVVRLGGDEFLLICAINADEADEADQVAQVLAARLQSLISEPVPHNGKLLAIGVSVGTITACGGSDPAAVLTAADQAMYERKRARKAVATIDGGELEAKRVATLRGLDVLDTEPDPVLDEMVEAAALVAGVPTALVSLLDEHRQWFKARCGLGVDETGRDISFCGHVVHTDAELHVADATADPRFCDNPLVTGPLGIRSYAGFPLRNADGYVLGSLCVIGYRPGSLDDTQRQVLRILARQVSARLDVAVPAPRSPHTGPWDELGSRVPPALTL